MMRRIRVLIVDDSALVREILSQGLASDPELEVVGTAADPYMARDKIIQLRPDVLTLDVEMPRMDGVEFLRRLMPQYPIPVVMVSALTKENAAITLAALSAGAVDFVTKPSSNLSRSLQSAIGELQKKIKVASRANLSAWKRKTPLPSGRPIQESALPESTDKVVAVGASTGGTEAIRRLIRELPANLPGMVVVQHMPPGFTKHFADSLNLEGRLEVTEAKSGDRVMPGRVLIAPGGEHMTVRRSGGVYIVQCNKGENVNGHCPSVDVLFDSVARVAAGNAVGIILTGMGADGAEGLLKMRLSGARTIGQDEATSIVYGMPKVADDLGAVEEVQPLEGISGAIVRCLGGVWP